MTGYFFLCTSVEFSYVWQWRGGTECLSLFSSDFIFWMVSFECYGRETKLSLKSIIYETQVNRFEARDCLWWLVSMISACLHFVRCKGILCLMLSYPSLLWSCLQSFAVIMESDHSLLTAHIDGLVKQKSKGRLKQILYSYNINNSQT